MRIELKGKQELNTKEDSFWLRVEKTWFKLSEKEVEHLFKVINKYAR